MAVDDGRVISNFIVQALRGDDLTIYGDGSQTRSFCYQSDIVEAMVRLMSHDDDDSPTNIGNPTEITVAELADQVIQATNSSSKVLLLPRPLDDPMQRRPDITKARNLLNWEPKVSLADGLSKTIQYFASVI